MVMTPFEVCVTATCTHVLWGKTLMTGTKAPPIGIPLVSKAQYAIGLQQVEVPGGNEEKSASKTIITLLRRAPLAKSSIGSNTRLIGPRGLARLTQAANVTP
jgi:hypothetical protein